MEGARADTTDFGYKMGRRKRGAEEAAPNLALLRPEQIVREIKRMEAEMYKRARNLEFEEAARLRDAIEKMKQMELGLVVSGGENAGKSRAG
jgi:excinuclease ABC subunit B